MHARPSTVGRVWCRYDRQTTPLGKRSHDMGMTGTVMAYRLTHTNINHNVCGLKDAYMATGTDARDGTELFVFRRSRHTRRWHWHQSYHFDPPATITGGSWATPTEAIDRLARVLGITFTPQAAS
jgi:hypothetical protein